ncbi:cortical protein marker for cell polarity-domain-containing protein [Boeremia exigua]|uniref:cortical protein marker for cell polarity-domain-containing protein n=1 Tax=Boeremia exigua TaxID=749465 RepID=UPI001E8D14E9|nr:cortical protein marker for cell polarity-domain-containing protein [Boeremia exigua]KAH6637964.1 cortical protein marker for cell polarity-domain-containing protein [Boeremia exigua]
MRDSFASLLASRAGKLALSLLLTSSTHALTFTPVAPPNLNIDPLGRVAFAGDFDSISIYQYEGQTQASTGRTGALLSRYPNGVFAPINETDADIMAMCTFRSNDQDRVMFAGNFTSVGDLATPGGVAVLDPNSGNVTALAGLDGLVNTLYCDGDQVYLGGSFTGSNSRNAIIWKDGWQDLSFEGFNGPIYSIQRAPNTNIIFGGAFNGLGGNATVATANNTQIIPISNAAISAQTSSGLPGFTEPSAITCKGDFATQGSGSTWLLSDRSPGFWKAEFGFGFRPTKLRLFNTDFEGRGTKTFRYTALPDGGIMNLTYTDLSTGRPAYCDALCPLPEGNTTAQDFTFVNNIGMNAFRVDITDWYGNGAGLNGIQLFQDEMYSYAINDFNEPQNCGSTATAQSESTSTGSWQVTPSHDSFSEYLTAVLQGPDISTDAATVTFQPDIKQSGNYSVTVYTPGCLGDGTCGSRGRINVTAQMSQGGSDAGNILWQTNNYDKYDEIYNGPIDISDGFRPSVTLRPAPGQGPTPVTVVAQRVRFTLLKATSGNINGLFEYTPGKALADIELSDSVINQAGASLTPREKASVVSVVAGDDNLYVGGNFASSDGRNNIFSIGRNAQGPTALNGNGLDDQVNVMFHKDNTLYVGGNFTNTNDGNVAGLNGVASYVNNEWKALGAGVQGVVLFLVPFELNVTVNTPEEVLAVSGSFGTVNGFNGSPSAAVEGLAVWVPSQNNWLHNLNSTSFSASGRLMTYADAAEKRWFGGSITSGFLGANGAAELNSENDDLSLRTFPINIEDQQQPALRKRAIMEIDDLQTTGVRTGFFYNENGNNKTILAGHFAASGTDGQNITNVLIIDGNDSDKVTGFVEQVDANSTFAAVAVNNNVLFAGGVITGTVSNRRVAGIVAYDLSSNSFPSVQPPALQGSNVTVNAIAPRPKSEEIYVGGRFQSGGDLTCPGLCMWNTRTSQWNRPNNNVAGVVNALIWTSDTTLLVAGNLTYGDNTTMILSFDQSKNEFTEIAGANGLPGPVTALTVATKEGDQFWASGNSTDGTAYLQRFDGSKWSSVDNALFGAGTDIRGIQVLSLSEDHEASDIIDRDQDLLLMGQINITSFGTASGALFNGSTLVPFLLATTAENTAGRLSSIFVENPNMFFRQTKKHLAVGFIVLIALAIALALTFLLVVVGIIIEWYRKRAQGYSPAPQSYPDRLGNVGRLPPEQLFGTLSGPRAPTI